MNEGAADEVGGSSASGGRSLVDRVFRNPTTGRVVLAQFPNVPLAVFLAATLVRWIFTPAGAIGTAVSVVGTAALAWWSVLEIGWGASLFRRILGAVVLIGLVARLVLR